MYSRTMEYDEGSEGFTALVMKIAVFWDIAPLTPYLSRRFGRTYRLHLHPFILFSGLYIVVIPIVS
jgi:hypothetical protein